MRSTGPLAKWPRTTWPQLTIAEPSSPSKRPVTARRKLEGARPGSRLFCLVQEVELGGASSRNVGRRREECHGRRRRHDRVRRRSRRHHHPVAPGIEFRVLDDLVAGRSLNGKISSCLFSYFQLLLPKQRTYFRVLPHRWRC